MPRPSRYPPLPPVSPVQLALISSPPPRLYRGRALPISPAHTRSLLLAAARPRYPVSYIAVTRTPRELSLALKLATAPREPGPIRLWTSNRYLVPTPKSPTLHRNIPLSFEKYCPCPVSRRCGNWKPSPPRPKFYSPPYPAPRALPEMPIERLNKVLYSPPPVYVPTFVTKVNHALRRRRYREPLPDNF